MKQTLTQLFVRQFYRLNFGFFLVCFFILFGVINFRDMVYFHYALMERASEPAVMLLLMGIWLLYAIKCFGFGLRALQTTAHSFLYQLQGLADARQFYTFSYLQMLIYLPALAYALITTGVLIVHGKIAAAFIILLYTVLLIVVPGYIYQAKLNSSYKQAATIFSGRWHFSTGEKRFNTWLLHYLSHQRKGALLGIKTGSLILLQALVTYNRHRLNMESVCYSMLGLVAVHAILPYYVRTFADERLQFVRAMPLSIRRRYLWFLFTYAILLAPELLFLLLHLHTALPVSMLLTIYAVSLAQLCLYSSILHLPGITVERYMLLVAGLFFLSVLLLAAFPAWYLVVAGFAVSYILFAVFYERREANAAT